MPQESALVSRRKVAKGAAWTVPVVALGAAAPASAASCPTRTCPPTAIAFGTPSGANVSGTTLVYTSATSWGPTSVTGATTDNSPFNKQPGFRVADPLSGNSTAPWFGTGDEAANGATITVSKNAQINLTAGCDYTLTLRASTWQGQAQTTLNVTVGSQTIYSLTPPTSGTIGNGLSNAAIGPVTFTVPSTGAYTVGINISLAAAGGGSNNDVYVSDLVISCI